MAQIVVKTNTEEEAKTILEKVYEADRSSVYALGGECVHGPALTATIMYGREKYEVEIYSCYYKESSLSEMFDNE